MTCDGRKATIKVYRKATHTDRYIHFTSHQHPKALSEYVKCLIKRADKLCEENNRIEELNHLRRGFRANGYPLAHHLLDCTFSQPPASQNSKQPTQSESEVETKPKFLCLPYIKGRSEEVQRRSRGLNVRVTFKSLWDLLTKVKTPTPKEKRTGVVYEMPCLDCNRVYIGETGRSCRKEQWSTKQQWEEETEITEL